MLSYMSWTVVTSYGCQWPKMSYITSSIILVSSNCSSNVGSTIHSHADIKSRSIPVLLLANKMDMRDSLTAISVRFVVS